jgi:hypothetical protein
VSGSGATLTDAELDRFDLIEIALLAALGAYLVTLGIWTTQVLRHARRISRFTEASLFIALCYLPFPVGAVVAVVVGLDRGRDAGVAVAQVGGAIGVLAMVLSIRLLRTTVQSVRGDTSAWRAWSALLFLGWLAGRTRSWSVQRTGDLDAILLAWGALGLVTAGIIVAVAFTSDRAMDDLQRRLSELRPVPRRDI